jgi:hypothetical protein
MTAGQALSPACELTRGPGQVAPARQQAVKGPAAGEPSAGSFRYGQYGRS